MKHRGCRCGHVRPGRAPLRSLGAVGRRQRLRSSRTAHVRAPMNPRPSATQRYVSGPPFDPKATGGLLVTWFAARQRHDGREFSVTEGLSPGTHGVFCGQARKCGGFVAAESAGYSLGLGLGVVLDLALFSYSYGERTCALRWPLRQATATSSAVVGQPRDRRVHRRREDAEFRSAGAVALAFESPEEAEGGVTLAAGQAFAQDV